MYFFNLVSWNIDRISWLRTLCYEDTNDVPLITPSPALVVCHFMLSTLQCHSVTMVVSLLSWEFIKNLKVKNSSCALTIGSNSFSPGTTSALLCSFKGLNVILGLCKCNCSLAGGKELALPPGRNKVEGRIWAAGLVFATCGLEGTKETWQQSSFLDSSSQGRYWDNQRNSNVDYMLGNGIILMLSSQDYITP